MICSAPRTLRRILGRFRPSPFRVKVAVFMLPLLLPVGQNLSQQPAEADGGAAAALFRTSTGNPGLPVDVAPAWPHESIEAE